MRSADECSIIITPFTMIISSVFSLCLILSLLGNAIVIVTILGKSHRSRSITNFYLLNLALADLLRSIICIPSTLLSELTHCWLLGAIMCKIVAFLQPVGVCASAYTLAVIAIERYYAICRPLESRKWQTKKRAFFTITLVWLFSFSANVSSLFLYETMPIGNHHTCDTTKGRLIDFIYQLYLTFTLLFVPLALMVGLYGNVIFTLNTAINSDHPTTIEQQIIEKTLSKSSFSDWFVNAVNRMPSMRVVSKSLKEKNTLTIPPQSSGATRRGSFSSFFTTPRGSFDVTMLLRSTNQDKILIAKKKVTRMLITLVIVFAFCWVPSYVYWLLLRMADLAETSLWNAGLNSCLTILTYISSLANPITYCFMNKSFRASVLAYCKPHSKRGVARGSATHRKRSPSRETPKETPTNIPIIKVDRAVDNSVHI